MSSEPSLSVAGSCSWRICTPDSQTSSQPGQALAKNINTNVSTTGTDSDIYVTAQETISADFGSYPNNGTVSIDEFPEGIAIEDLIHKPPHLPISQNYSGFGKSSLRQSVISRQSSRLFPSNDRIVNQMEDQMVRWRVLGSDYNPDQVLNGKHPFQQSNLPIMEVQKISSISSDNYSVSPASTGETSETTDGSIVQSLACLNIDRNAQSRIQKIVTFKEEVGVFNGESTDTKQAIHDSFTEKEIARSASITSSIRQVLEDSDKISNSQKDQETSTNADENEQALTTPVASPLTENDMNGFTRNTQSINIDNPLAFSQNRNYDYASMDFLMDDNDKSCWEVTGEVFQDVWKDIIDICTCNFDLSDDALF